MFYQPSRLLYPFRVHQRLANGCFTNPRGCYPFRVHARLSSQLLYRIYWGGVPRRACAPRPAGGLTPCGRSVKPVTLRWLGPRRGGLARGRAFPRPLPEQLGDEVLNYAQPPAPSVCTNLVLQLKHRSAAVRRNPSPLFPRPFGETLHHSFTTCLPRGRPLGETLHHPWQRFLGEIM